MAEYEVRFAVWESGSLVDKGAFTSTGYTITDADTTSASTSLTSASGLFTAADVGQVVTGDGIPVGTRIAALVDPTEVTLSAAATATASGVTVTVAPTVVRDDTYTCSRVRNGIGDFNLPLSIWDTTAYSFLGIDQIIGRGEVRVYRDGALIWAGVTVGANASIAGQVVTWHCRTLEQYFAWLLFGKAERDNLVSNGDFEGGLTDWTTTGTTSAVETTIVNSGAKSAKLTGLGNIHQVVTGITHSYDPGLAIRLAFYVRVSQATATAEGDDFVIARLVGNDGTNEYVSTLTIGDVDRFDDFVRVSLDLLLAADRTWTVTPKLEGASTGSIYVDDVILAVNEAVTVAFPHDDLTVLVENIVSHAQDTGFGKKDLGITVDPTPTGIEVLKGYAFADHENIWDSLQALAVEFDCDIWIDLDRVVHVEPKRGGAVGGLDRDISVPPNEPDRSAAFRALGDFADVTVSCDASQQRSTIIAGAEGPDFAREEAGASTSGFGFGPIVVSEEYVVAPASTKVRDLQVYADSILARKSRAAAFPSLIYPWADAGAVEPGDTGDITIDVGCIYLSGTYRVETWAVNMVNDTCQVAFDLDL